MIINIKEYYKSESIMLEAFLVTFREGIEAFLIVAVSLAYLRKTGRDHLVPAVYAGIAAALILSAVGGYFLQSYIDTPLAEGLLAIAAGILVASLTVHMMIAGKKIAGHIKQKLESSAVKSGTAAVAGIFTFTLLMIAREGMETVLILSSMASNFAVSSILSGFALGVLGTAAMGYAWIKHSHAINIGRFLQVTGIFLVLFAIHLFLYGFYEITEMTVLPIDNEYWHALVKPLVKKTTLSYVMNYSFLGVPLLWLGFTWAKETFFKPQLSV